MLQFFNFIIGILGLPKVLVEQISSITSNKYVLLITLIVFYMILGCFLETLSMMIATVPIIIPLIVFYEIDPVWFGIFFVLIMQISLITPPVGNEFICFTGLERTRKNYRCNIRICSVCFNYGIANYFANYFS